MDRITLALSQINLHSSTLFLISSLRIYIDRFTSHVLWPVSLLPLLPPSVLLYQPPPPLSCSLFNPSDLPFFSGPALHKTMRAIPLSVEGERTRSTVLQGPVLSGNLCRSDRGSAAGLSIKHSCCACETTHPGPTPFSICVDVLTLATTLFTFEWSD